MENDQPLLVLRPEFRSIPTLLSSIPGQLFLTPLVGCVCGGIVSYAFQIIPLFQVLESGTSPGVSEWIQISLAPIALFGIITFFGWPIANYLLTKRAYGMIKYHFFSAKLEYYDRFISVTHKTIGYPSIIEITVRQGPVQRMFGLGDLVLSTAATGMAGRVSTSGIVLNDLENPYDVYQQVRGIWSQREMR